MGRTLAASLASNVSPPLATSRIHSFLVPLPFSPLFLGSALCPGPASSISPTPRRTHLERPWDLLAGCAGAHDVTLVSKPQRRPGWSGRDRPPFVVGLSFRQVTVPRGCADPHQTWPPFARQNVPHRSPGSPLHTPTPPPPTLGAHRCSIIESPSAHLPKARPPPPHAS